MDALGVDIGGVIIGRVDNNADTSFFGDNYLATPASPDVFDVLARLVKHRFGPRVYLVSKCGQRVQNRSLEWLAHHRFYERTGISPERVRFCRERSGKAAIAAELGLTHFVDDRLEVLGYLVGIVAGLFLYQPQEREIQRNVHYLPHVHRAETWTEVEAAILTQAA